MEDGTALATRVWNAWLDGDSINRMARTDEIAPRATIEKILCSDPPEDVRSDPRYVHQGRFFWISASGLVHPQTREAQPFVVVKRPRAHVGPVFVTALRAIRREVRSLGADLDLHVLEGEDAATLIRFVAVRGYLGFQFDEEGTVTRFEPSAPSAEPEPTAPIAP